MNFDNAIIWIIIGGVVVVILVIVAVINAAMKAEERKQRIYQKYGRTRIAENIIAKTIWIGETADQLFESLGQPLDIDQKVLKTKKKEIWKYNQTGTNRYSLKITLDNDIVVGWDLK